MSDNPFPLPRTTPTYKEHEVARPGRSALLAERIPDDPRALEVLKGRHVLSARSYNRELVLQLLRRAATWELTAKPYPPHLSGRVLITAFLDQQVTRSQLSFTSAAKLLSANTIDLGGVPTGRLDDPGALAELTEILNSYGDTVILRTPDRESFREIVDDARIPVINAGNGDDENPSQALVDLYTIFKWRPELVADEVPEEKRLQVGIFGPPARTRTVRSLLWTMALFPQAFSRVVIFGRYQEMFEAGQREALEASGLPLDLTAERYPDETMVGCLRREFPELDVIYVHLPAPLEMSVYDRHELVKLLKPNTMMLHPAAHSKSFGVEMDDSPHNAYFCQARGAVFVRMALLDTCLRT